MCRLAARAIARIDREQALGILPLQDLEADALLAALPADERLASWRFVAPDGTLSGYGAAVPALLETMRLTRPLGRLLGLVPARVLDRTYGLVARNRARFRRVVPDRPGPRRLP